MDDVSICTEVSEKITCGSYKTCLIYIFFLFSKDDFAVVPNKKRIFEAVTFIYQLSIALLLELRNVYFNY